MRLRFVQTCSFVRNELTNFMEVLAKHPEFSRDGIAKLKRDDVVLLISKMGNQLVFLHGFDFIERSGKKQHTVLRSLKLRLSGRGTWDPLMLSEYAKDVGIKLDGIKAFEDHVRKEQRVA